MPTQAMGPGDEAYAIAAAVPLNAPGVTLIFGRQTNEERKIEEGHRRRQHATSAWSAARPWWSSKMSSSPGSGSSCAARWISAGTLVERFATLHRQNYGGCKGGVADIMVGATALAAEYQGTLKASHVKDKLAEMTHLAETIYSGSVACSAMGSKTKSGAYYPDPLLANCTKYNVTKHIYEISRLAHDVAGGIMATLPFDKDLKNPEIGKYVEKYMKGVNGVSTENRMQILRLLENMTGGTALVEPCTGPGSPQSQRVMYQRLGKLPEKMKMAKKLAKIAE